MSVPAVDTGSPMTEPRDGVGRSRDLGDHLRGAARRSGFRRAVTWQRHRGLNQHDLFVASYPRSGNTWLRFLLADLVAQRDIDFAAVEAVVPVVGRHADAPRALPGGGRVIKTHEPFRREYRRAIYIVRDVRDVALSYERFITGYGIRYASRQEFLRAFMTGTVGGYGAWVDHVASWRERRPRADVLVLRYEDLRRDPLAALRAAVAHAGLDRSLEQLERTLGNNSLAAMGAKERRNKDFIAEQLGWDGDHAFVGAGAVGGWRGRLSRADLEILASAVRFQERSGPPRPA